METEKSQKTKVTKAGYRVAKFYGKIPGLQFLLLLKCIQNKEVHSSGCV